MKNEEKPAAKAPRKRADVWARECAQPAWLIAAAVTVARLTHGPDAEITADEFGAALERAR